MAPPAPSIDAISEEFDFNNSDKTVRWFQTATVNQSNAAIENGSRRLHIKLPTQTGKTFTACLLLTNIHFRRLMGIHDARKIKVLWVAHKHRLLTQAEKELTNFGGIEVRTQSAFSKLPASEEFEWDVCLMDECHHEAMMSIQMKLEGLRHKMIIGLTATDDRADGALIKFDTTVECLTRAQAVEEGWLSETDLNTIIDYNPMKKRADVVIQILENFYDDFDQTLIFMATRAQCKEIAEWMDFRNASYVLLLDQEGPAMDAILDSFSRGEIQFIINCAKIDEGVDVAGATDLILARQYGSYPQLNQVIGRISKPDSDCRVWEFMHPFKDSLTALNVVGEAREHRLFYKKNSQWQASHMPKADQVIQQFDAI